MTMNAHWNGSVDRRVVAARPAAASGGGFAALALAGFLAEESRASRT